LGKIDRTGRDYVVSSGFDNSSATAIRASTWSRIVSRITQWRNWRLGLKLTAVVLVPVIFAVTLGVLQIHDQTRQAAEYSRLDRVVRTAASVRAVAAALQEERTRTAEFLVNGPVPVAALQQSFAASDRAANAVAFREHRSTDLVVRLAHADADRQLSQVPELRRQILTIRMDPVAAVNTYTSAIGALLALDRTLIGQLSSAQLSSTATSLHELAQVGEEMRLQRALVLPGLLRGFTPETRARLGDSETRRISASNEFRAAATPEQRQEYDRVVTRPDFPAHDVPVGLVLTGHQDSLTAANPMVSAVRWEAQSRSAVDAITAMQARMDEQLHRTAFVLRDNASDMAGLESVILLSALLIASAVVVVVTRQLLGSLELLRSNALDTANAQLPRAVASIRAGSRATVDRVPVDTSEEIGELARAFDAVHTQAITLASEQAELRKNYRDSFVNVSRRSQSLLERQLRLFEHLERDEEDPEQLATLFRLDHLATRMRRNNENLMVLSGADLARRFAEPTSPADLLRAAVSEIEHYPRVVVQPVPDTKIVGYVANDLVRLLAELLDNAANFSAPQTKVTVSGHRRGDGSLGIDVLDRGIGMADAELAAANARLATDGEVELSTSRRMGLFVVGRLANRHGVGIELHRGPEDTGIRAAVTLGPELLLDTGYPTVGARTNGASHDPPARHMIAEDTPVKEVEWSGDSDVNGQPQPTRNGFHLLDHEAQADPEVEREPRAQANTPAQPRGLFTPADGQPEPQQGESATSRQDPNAPTPIFDDLASAWFRVSRSPKRTYPLPEEDGVRWPARPADRPEAEWSTVDGSIPRSRPEQEPPPSDETEPPTERHLHVRRNSPIPDATEQWNFSSDQARRRAEEVCAAEPAEYTTAGLPRRTPQAYLVAGSADTGTNGTGPQRDPEATRGRLSNFQQGLRQGRHRSDGYSANSGTANGAAGGENGFRSTSEWHFRDDPAAFQPEPPREPVDYTSAGLPRRNPRSHLVPGTRTEPNESATPPRRDADFMRGRLASFQRGVREGKHTLRNAADDRSEDHR
jgi:signal transduction histidine kinase